MGLFSRQRNTQTQHELVRRHITIDEITDLAIEAHTAIGTERRAAAQQVHDILEQAQQMLNEAGPHLSAARRQALFIAYFPISTKFSTSPISGFHA